MRTPTLFLSALMLATACREGRPLTDAGRDSGGGGFDAGDCTPSPENTVAACADGINNDCDMHTDCNDFDCCGVVACAPTTSCGMRDGGTVCTPTGAENTATACGDGVDNDCNGFSDCDDFSCCQRMNPARTDCPAMTACNPSCGGTEAPENTIGRCMDRCDNNGDDFFDCEDRACCLIRVAAAMSCPPSSFCVADFMPMGVSLCAGADLAAEAPPENTLTACTNSCDDDRDGFQDCGDRGCCDLFADRTTDCGATTLCHNVCDTMGTEDAAAACGNGCDDDRDGHIDCDDRDCMGVGACP